MEPKEQSRSGLLYEVEEKVVETAKEFDEPRGGVERPDRENKPTDSPVQGRGRREEPVAEGVGWVKGRPA